MHLGPRAAAPTCCCWRRHAGGGPAGGLRSTLRARGICRKALDYIRAMLNRQVAGAVALEQALCLPLPPGADARPRVVLDSNVVMDWLLFDEPMAQPLGHAVASGLLRWVGTESTLGEVCHVLQLPGLARWQHNLERAHTCAQALCQLVSVPAPLPQALRLRCSDRDDQKFIDLALALPADWLVTRDHALLKLARKALPLGVRVCTPAVWAATARERARPVAPRVHPDQPQAVSKAVAATGTIR